MIIQKKRAAQVGLVAAATMAAGLAVAGAAGAAPPAHASASVANDTLTVLGTNGDDTMTLGSDAVDPGAVTIDFGNGTLPQSFARSSFSSISVFLRGGDDQFQAGRGIADETLTVQAGAGNDTVFGGDGNDVIFGGSGADLVDGGAGTDTEILGAGNDTARWNPGEGNDLVLGGAGTDTLTFNGSNAAETMSLSANGPQAVLHRDIANIRMDLDQVETVDIAAIGGADTLTVNDLSGTNVRNAALDLSAQGAGDGQADTVVVNGTNTADHIDVAAAGGSVNATGLHAGTTISGAEPFDRLLINSGGGNDRVRVSPEAAATLTVAVDLGTGQQ